MADLLPIKVTVAGTRRRLSLPASPPPTFGALLAAAAAPHGLAPSDVAAATYTDADGDEVTLSSDAELTEALRGGGVLRLTLVALPPPTPSAPPSPLPTDDEGEGKGLGGTADAGEASAKGVLTSPLYPSVNRSEDHPLAPLSPLYPDADPPDSLDGEVAEGAALVVARPGPAVTPAGTGSLPEWTPPPRPSVEVVVAAAPDAPPPQTRLSEVLGEGLKAAIDVGVEPIVKAAKLAWADGEGLRLLGEPSDLNDESTGDRNDAKRDKCGRDVCVRDSGDDSVGRPALPAEGAAALATSLHGALTDGGVAWAPATAIATALHALLTTTWVGRAVRWMHAKHVEKERKAANRRRRRQQGSWWQGPPSAKASQSASGWGGPWGAEEGCGGCGHRRCGGMSTRGRWGAC